MEKNKKLKVIFMGTPDFACPTLAKLYFDENIDLCLVVTKEDKPFGRGKEMQESDIKKLTKALNQMAMQICEKKTNKVETSAENNFLNDKNSKKNNKIQMIIQNTINSKYSINDKKCEKIILSPSISTVMTDSLTTTKIKMPPNQQIPIIHFDNTTVATIRDIKPDFIVVVAYGKVLKKEILEIPRYGCINGHASLLPKYRGSSPVQNCIKNGENETGVTTMLMGEGLDTGDILKVKKIKIEDSDTGGSLFEKLSYLTADCILETLKDFDNIIPVKQDESQATYVKMITKEDGLIEPEKETKKQVLNKIRAYNPWPSTHLILNGSRIKINRAKSLDNDEIIKKIPENQNCEKEPLFYIVDRSLYLRVLDGFLEILELQPEGRRNMAAKDYINGLK